MSQTVWTPISQQTNLGSLRRLEEQYKGFGYRTKVSAGPKVRGKKSWQLRVSKTKNPRQPSRRVGKSLKKYVSKEIAGLPTKYTPAQVRVDSKGEIDIKFARPPAGPKRNPKGFKARVAAYRQQRAGITLPGGKRLRSGIGKSLRVALRSKNGKKRKR